MHTLTCLYRCGKFESTRVEARQSTTAVCLLVMRCKIQWKEQLDCDVIAVAIKNSLAIRLRDPVAPLARKEGEYTE